MGRAARACCTFFSHTMCRRGKRERECVRGRERGLGRAPHRPPVSPRSRSAARGVRRRAPAMSREPSLLLPTLRTARPQLRHGPNLRTMCGVRSVGVGGTHSHRPESAEPSHSADGPPPSPRERSVLPPYALRCSHGCAPASDRDRREARRTGARTRKKSCITGTGTGHTHTARNQEQ